MKASICLVLLFSLGACKKQGPLKSEDLPPAKCFVLLDKEGRELLTSTSTPLRVSATNLNGQYFELGSECAGGGCQMINAYPVTNYRPYNFFYASSGFAVASISGISTWHLTLNGKTDTLFFDLKGLDPSFLDPANATFNGTPITIDRTLSIPAYVLRRRH